MDASALTTYKRYILAGLGERVLYIPDAYVSEVVMVDRTYVLPMPFYHTAVLGVAPHQGSLLPLLLLRRALGDTNALVPETLVVVFLSVSAPLAGAALVVDRVLGSVSQMPEQPEAVSMDEVCAQLPKLLWQPQRWYQRAQVS
jgi:chemotaxis signal transduction protein